MRVKTFTEKPDVEIARVFMASGEFLWNSGIFVWRASVLRDELAEHMPELTAWFGGWEDALGTPNEGEFLQRAYSGIQKSSIDLGIMESTSKAWVYPADFDWADIFPLQCDTGKRYRREPFEFPSYGPSELLQQPGNHHRRKETGGRQGPGQLPGGGHGRRAYDLPEERGGRERSFLGRGHAGTGEFPLSA